MCKANYALTVNGKMSARPSLGRYNLALIPLKVACMASEPASWVKKELDIGLCGNIIVFTVRYGNPAADQTIIASPAGHAESSPSGSPPRELSKQRLFRSGRSAPGQVRDAAAGGYRQTAGQPGSQSVRLLAPVVLSGAGRISRSWPRCSVATKARSPVRTQADGRTHAVCGATPGRRAGDIQSPVGRASRSALRRLGSPAQHRSSAAASKKTSVSPEPTLSCLADRRLVAAYEELRCQALQGWRRGPGLALMMSRGFRCWMEACSQLLANECSRAQALDRPEPSVSTGIRGELVILLASMLLRRVWKGIA
jgi:hypothetical protein